MVHTARASVIPLAAASTAAPPRLWPISSFGASSSARSQSAAASRSPTFEEKLVLANSPSLAPSPVKSKRSTPIPCRVSPWAMRVAAKTFCVQVKQCANSANARGRPSGMSSRAASRLVLVGADEGDLLVSRSGHPRVLRCERVASSRIPNSPTLFLFKGFRGTLRVKVGTWRSRRPHDDRLGGWNEEAASGGRRSRDHRRARLGRGVHQHPDRRHQRRLLPVGRGALQHLREGHSGREVLGAGDQGFGGEPQPAASRTRRDRVHAGRLRSASPGRETRTPAFPPSSTSCAASPASIPTTSRSSPAPTPASRRSPT